MRPDWKEYTAHEWYVRIIGYDGKAAVPNDRFIFNTYGVCINPHVLGIMVGTWRIGVKTGRTPAGRWVVGSDVSFPSMGFSRGAADGADTYPEERSARVAELRRISLQIEQGANQESVSCPIPASTAKLALRLIAEKLADLEPKKVPIYTQLSLW